ncbi:MAG: hypothetical protein AABY22_34845, partial [Nanoarchaeota archaeon]
MYTPVEQRKTSSTQTGYIPVSQRALKEVVDLKSSNTKPLISPLINNIIAPKNEIPYNSTLKGMVENTIKGIPASSVEVGKSIGGFFKDVGQSIARNIGSAALTLSGSYGALQPIKTQPSEGAIDPLSAQDFQSPFAQSLFETVFGKDEEIKPIETRVAEAEIKLQDFGKDLEEIAKTPNLNSREKFVVENLSKLVKNSPKSLAFIGVMGSVGLDLAPFGGIEKNAFKEIVKARTVGDASIVLQKLGIADDLIKTFADDVAKVATEKEAEKLVTVIANLQQRTKKAYVSVAERAIFEKPVNKNTAQAVEEALQTPKAGEDFGPRTFK